MEVNSLLLSEVEKVLGKGWKRSKANYAFHCPFCNHKKPKLEIDLGKNPDGLNRFACWVCGTRGRTIISLINRLSLTGEEVTGLLKYVERTHTTSVYETEIKDLRLPKEFIPLWEVPENKNFTYSKVKKYLKDRGLTKEDILKYRLGYCVEGVYQDRIIIPSYDSSLRLNYFTARSFNNTKPTYKQPDVERDDIIFFEHLINWTKPLILVEGPFDAISVKRNVVPLLGKFISSALLIKILGSKLEDIYILLDNDAKKQALILAQLFLGMGKRVFLVDTKNEKDPGELGFTRTTNLLQTSKELTLETLIEAKLNV